MKYIVLAGEIYYPNGASDIRGMAGTLDECLQLGILALDNEYKKDMSPAQIILYPIDYTDYWIEAYEIATGKIISWMYYDDKWRLTDEADGGGADFLDIGST